MILPKQTADFELQSEEDKMAILNDDIQNQVREALAELERELNAVLGYDPRPVSK